eukprot:8459705-Lingulodinium_polyedra.AAC.1
MCIRDRAPAIPRRNVSVRVLPITRARGLQTEPKQPTQMLSANYEGAEVESKQLVERRWWAPTSVEELRRGNRARKQKPYARGERTIKRQAAVLASALPRVENNADGRRAERASAGDADQTVGALWEMQSRCQR